LGGVQIRADVVAVFAASCITLDLPGCDGIGSVTNA